MDAYVPKPIEPEKLVRTIRAVLNREYEASELRALREEEDDREPFDVTRVLERYGGNSAIVRALLEKFPEELEKTQKLLVEAAYRARVEDVKFAAHKLRGVAGVFPAHRLCALSEYLETRWDEIAADDRRSLLESIRDEVQRCQAHIPEAVRQLGDASTPSEAR